MTTARLNWPDELGAAETIVPVVLIAGVPVVLTPCGVVPTATAVSAGTVDDRWWPGVGSLTITRPASAGTFSPVIDLLDVGVEWSVHEEAETKEGLVKVDPLRFDLFDDEGVVTALLSARDARSARRLGSDTTDASGIPLDSLGGVPSAGYAHVGREAVGYNGNSSGALVILGTGTGRGLFGSRARPHLVGDGSRRPLVVFGDHPRHWQGRRASVFLCRVSGTTLYDPTLVFVGTVGAEVAMLGGFNRWQLPLDPAVETMRRKFAKRSVRLFGWQHAGGAQPWSGLTMDWSTAFGTSLYLGPEDGGGWSPDATTFLTLLHAKATSGAYGVQLSPQGGRAYIHGNTRGGDYAWSLFACWDSPQIRSGTDVEIDQLTGPLPEACLHLHGALRIGRSVDWAQIPTTLSWTVTSPARGTAYLALAAKTDAGDKVVAKITARDDATLTLTLEAAVDGITPGATATAELEAATRITSPTDAVVGFITEGDTATAALRAMGEAQSEVFGTDLEDDSIAWDEIARTFASIPLGAIPDARSFRFTGDEDSTLTRLAHEARLRGCALCVRRGLVSVYRPADFAPVEPVVATITPADFLADPVSGDPLDAQLVDGAVPIATAVRFTLRPDGEIVWRDQTSLDEFGEGDQVECRALEALPPDVNPLGLLSDVQRFAQQTLGPLVEPQRVIKLFLPATFYSLDTGDLVALTHPAIPDWRGNRGLDAATCQVVGASRTFGTAARVELSVRLALAPDLAGYAPEALVAAGGISGAVLTLDTSTPWGSNGFAPDTDREGNPVTANALYGFAVGDRVVVSQLDAESPIADESFTIDAIAWPNVTLSGSPSAPMVAAAAAQYGCVLRFAPWTDGAVTARQRAYAYVADASAEDLGTGDAPKRWAS